MSIQVAEKQLSRGGDEADRELRYVVIADGDDAGDDVGVRTAVEAVAPAIYAGLSRTKIRIEGVVVTTGQRGVYEATATYGVRSWSPPQTGEASWSFDTTGGTQKVTQSLHTKRYADGIRQAPNFHGAIGVTQHGVEGCEVTVPVYKWTETHYLDCDTVTAEYKGKIFNLTGKVNNDTWHGMAAGEALFLGASGSKRGKQDWEVTFHFAAAPNQDALMVDNISGIEKKGFEYLWVLYEDDVDGNATFMIKKPRAVYVEQVYYEGNFDDLALDEPQ